MLGEPGEIVSSGPTATALESRVGVADRKTRMPIGWLTGAFWTAYVNVTLCESTVVAESRAILGRRLAGSRRFSNISAAGFQLGPRTDPFGERRSEKSMHRHPSLS
jgi:hypothetical protein